MEDFKEKKVLILGLGVSGRAVADFLLPKGATLYALDERGGSMEGVTLLNSFPGFPIDLVVKSPGIPPTHPWLKEVRAPVTSEIALALENIRGKKLYAVTGSNGKTTTVLLTTHLMKSAGLAAEAVGNVGTPLISRLDSPAEFFVVELSSFQLEGLKLPLFDAGVILNISENHLNWHPSFESYVQAKLQLQECVKPEGRFFVQEGVHTRFGNFFTKKEPIPFSLFHEKVESIFSLSYRGVKPHLSACDFENLTAAYLLCREALIGEESLRVGIESFTKPPHRMEFVCAVGGVRYINDSKATTVDAVRKAVESIEGNIVLIAGGIDKGGTYSEWIPLFRNKVKCILVIGEASSRMHRELSDSIQVERVGTLRNAVERAHHLARPGETVMLSPACSSFDQFSDYQERGDQFKQYVREIEP